MDSLAFLFKNIMSSNTVSFNADNKRTTITRLKFLGTIEPHQKIDITSLKIESNSVWIPIKRWLSGSSRETTMNFFSSTIERSIDIIKANLASTKKSDKIFVANMVADLIAAVKGLRAAQITYSDDKMTVCSIESHIESIQGEIMEIQDQYPDVFTIKTSCVMNLEKSLGKKLRLKPEDEDRTNSDDDTEESPLP